MRAKPDMEPWVNTDKSGLSSFRSGTITRAFVLRFGSAAPLGLNKCISMLNPGLAPWAMQEYRPYRAHFSECVVKIGMGGLCVIIVFGLGLRALLSKCIVKIGMGEGGVLC